MGCTKFLRQLAWQNNLGHDSIQYSRSWCHSRERERETPDRRDLGGMNVKCQNLHVSLFPGE